MENQQERDDDDGDEGEGKKSREEEEEGAECPCVLTKGSGVNKSTPCPPGSRLRCPAGAFKCWIIPQDTRNVC